jgi:hypothetical protein
VTGLNFRELSLKIIDDAVPQLSVIRMLIHGGGDEAEILKALGDLRRFSFLWHLRASLVRHVRSGRIIGRRTDRGYQSGFFARQRLNLTQHLVWGRHR